MKKIVAGIIILFCVVSAGFVWAQTTTQQESEYINNQSDPIKEQEEFLENIRRDIENGTVKPEELPPPLLQLVYSESAQLNGQESTISQGAVSCFDYYTFNSITADITSSTNDAVSGTSMDFYGTLTNKNPYPIVEGTLYVKVLKSTGPEKNPNGPDVVDQFIAVDNINIPANGSVPVEFTWNVPAYAVSGDYRLATFFTSDKKFNLLGLSFTDDIVGNEYLFTISGEQDEYIMFDKSSVVINDNPYYFAAYPPRIEPEKPANVSVSVLNNTDEYRDVNVLWKLYKWDAMHPDNFVREFSSVASIQANSASEISVSIDDADAPVYLLIGEIQERDTKSIVNIRYVRGDIDKVRLNFPAVTKFPLQEGEDATVFTCLHNAGQSHQVLNNKVILEVRNAKGKVIESHIYEGTITGEMMAIKKDFKPKKSLDKFSVYSAIYTNDKLVDESTMEYDCALIDPRTCQEKDAPIIWIIISIIGLIGLLVIFQKMKNKKSLLVLFMFVIGFAVLNPSISEASRSTTWSETFTDRLAYYGTSGENVTAECFDFACFQDRRILGVGWADALANFNVTVKYYVKITNADTGTEIRNGDSIPVGTRIKLDFVEHESNHISWFGTGYSVDSPYGEWREEGTAPPAIDTCREKDFVNRYTLQVGRFGTSDYNIYVPLVIDSPNKWFSELSGLIDCEDGGETEINGKSKTCTVSAELAGQTFSPNFIFGTTTGKFYYRYKYLGSTFSGTSPVARNTCISNNVALRKIISGSYLPGPFANNGRLTVDSSGPFTITVPRKTISYDINVYQPNRPPSSPTITGPTSGNTGTQYTFTFTATDPDGDKIRYGIDWDNNNSVNEWVPASGYVDSGTSQSDTRSWSTTGSKTIRVIAQDQKGTNSESSYHAITISNPPATHTITFDGNGATGGSMSQITNIAHGSNVTLTNNGFYKTGYTFAGWSEDIGGAVEWTNQQVYSSVTMSNTIHAVWNPIPPPANPGTWCSLDGTQIHFWWQRASGYPNIYFRLSPTSTWNGSQWTDRSLWNEWLQADTHVVNVTPGVRYTWWAHTRGDNNWSTAVGWDVTCNAAPATACSGVNVYNNHAYINWSYEDPENDPLTGYHVQVFDNPSFTGTPVTEGWPIPATQNTDVAYHRYWRSPIKLDPYKNYYARVSTYNNVNQWTPGWKYCPVFQTIPKPTNPVATCSADGTQVTISWNRPAGYNKTNFRLSPTSTWNGSQWTDQSLWFNGYDWTSVTRSVTPGVNYSWWLETAGEGYNHSEYVYGNITCTPPPPPPTNATATCSPDGTQVTISWNNPVGYNSIYYRMSLPSTLINGQWTDRSLWYDNYQGTSRTVNVQPGVEYWWWIHTFAPNWDWSREPVGGPITCTNTRYTITFNGNGADGGSSMPPMINLVPGSSLTLPANQFTRTGYTFAGWATSAEANVSYTNQARYSNITGNVTLFAKWNQIPVSSYLLSVTKLGSGSGTITSIPSGISCGTDCTENYSNNTSVTLTASAAQGSTFTGWSGACAGDASTCTVLMDQERTVNANFNQSPPGGTDATGTFYFRPNIADNAHTCPLTIDVQHIKSCTLTKLGANTFTLYTPPAGSISLFETESQQVGTYKLTCTGTNDTQKIIGTKSCYSNGDVRED